MKNTVVGIGEVLWDMLPEGRKIGGAPANFAFHVSQFGIESCVASAVGRDASGRDIIDTLASRGLDMLIAEVDFPTGSVAVDIDDRGVPHYEIKEDVAWDNIPFSAELQELALRTRAVCFGSLAQRSERSRSTINRFIDAVAQNEDSLIVFDINLRQNYYDAETLSCSMNRCNILKINDEELEELSRLFSYQESDPLGRCRHIMSDYGIEILILTCGIDGSYVMTSDSLSFLPTPRVEVADTVGAGDSFTAAFIAGLLKGRSIADSHARAVRTSAYVCTRSGAMPALPQELKE